MPLASHAGLWVFLSIACTGCFDEPPSLEGHPNVVLILADDMGWGDIGPNGADNGASPELDRMAREGRVFTDFYVTAPSCTGSRAGLLTGCYTYRISMPGVLGSRDHRGLNPSEVTLAEICKQVGYRTAMFGKWHLGDAPEFMPLEQGFDRFLGLPYSHDMRWDHPRKGPLYGKLPLFDGRRIVDDDVDAEEQAELTSRLTESAVEFIHENRDRPFFLYFAHFLPHVPLRVEEEYVGRTDGPYGDAVSLVDASVGRILEALRSEGLDQRTLTIFTSDNGPWLNFGRHAGTGGPFREGKGTTFEGGVREPCVLWFPGTIPAGTTCSVPSMTIDLLPTVAGLIGAELPEHPIDGLDIWPLMSGEPDAPSPHEAYFFFHQGLEAVRSGRWKLHFEHNYKTLNGRPGGTDGQSVFYETLRTGKVLYDLTLDPGETTDLIAQHPEVAERLTGHAQVILEDLGVDFAHPGPGRRPAGRIQRD